MITDKTAINFVKLIMYLLVIVIALQWVAYAPFLALIGAVVFVAMRYHRNEFKSYLPDRDDPA